MRPWKVFIVSTAALMISSEAHASLGDLLPKPAPKPSGIEFQFEAGAARRSDFDYEQCVAEMQDFARMNMALDPEARFAGLLSENKPVTVREGGNVVLLTCDGIWASYSPIKRVLFSMSNSQAVLGGSLYRGKVLTDEEYDHLEQVNQIPASLENFGATMFPNSFPVKVKREKRWSYIVYRDPNGFFDPSSMRVSLSPINGQIADITSLLMPLTDYSLTESAKVSHDQARESALEYVSRLSLSGTTFMLSPGWKSIHQFAWLGTLKEFGEEHVRWERSGKRLPVWKFQVWNETDLKGWIEVCAMTGKSITFNPANMLTLSQPVPRIEVPDEHMFRVLETDVQLDARTRAPESSESEKGVPVFLVGKNHLIKGRYIPNRGVAVRIDGEEVMLQTTHEQRAVIAKAAGTKKAFGSAERRTDAMN